MFVNLQKLRPSQFLLHFNAIADGISEGYNTLPVGMRFCVRPMFYLALGLHLALLFSPLPEQSKPAEPKPEPSPTPETVKIMRLPPPQKTAPKQPAPTTAPPKTPTPTATPRPRVPTVAPVLPKANPAQPSPQVPSPSQPTPATEQKTSESPPTPANSPSTPSPDTPPPAAPPPPTLEEFFRKFPQYPGASAGSGGVLRSEFDQSTYIYHATEGVDAVGAKFEQSLAAAQFKVAPGTVATDFKVYSVTLGPITQYLHLIGGGDGKTAMVVLPNAYSLEQLKTAQTDEMDPDTSAFETITQQFGREFGERLRSPDPSQLVQAGQFGDINRFDLRSMTAAAFLSPPSQSEIINYFSQKLGAEGFAVNPAGSYGGGSTYQVTRGKLSRCIIFAPTNISSDNSGTPGTAVILSASCP